jgi:4-oxalocrotonate tautomerase
MPALSLGGDDMPYVNVRISADGNSPAQKLKVIQGITKVLVDELGKDPAAIFVVIDEVDTDNWGHYGDSVTNLRKARAAAAKAPGKADAPKVQRAPVKRGAARK